MYNWPFLHYVDPTVQGSLLFVNLIFVSSFLCTSFLLYFLICDYFYVAFVSLSNTPPWWILKKWRISIFGKAIHKAARLPTFLSAVDVSIHDTWADISVLLTLVDLCVARPTWRPVLSARHVDLSYRPLCHGLIFYEIWACPRQKLTVAAILNHEKRHVFGLQA